MASNFLSAILASINQAQSTFAPYAPAKSNGGGGSALDALTAALNNGMAIPTSASAQSASASGGFVWMGQRINLKQAQSLHTADAALAWSKQLKDQLSKNSFGGRVPGSTDAAANLPFTWNEKQRQAAYKRAADATGQPVAGLADFLKIWNSAVGLAEQSWTATGGGKNGSPMTPWDVLDLMKREGTGGTSLARTVTSHSTSVEKLSAGSTWAVLQDAATRALGRAPTSNELKQFASKANSIAVHNPTRTSTTTRTNALGQVVSQSSTSQQGASAGDYQLAAQNQAATPEAGAYQAATTLYNAFASALNSPVSM